MIIICSVLFALLVFAIGLAYQHIREWGHIEYDISQPVRLNIKRGESASNIILKLKDHGIIDNQKKAVLYYRLFFPEKTLKAGIYEVPEKSSYHEVLSMIVKGDILTQRITIIEGLTLWDINEIFSRHEITDHGEFMSLCHDQDLIKELGVPFDTLEGFLYPDTYLFPLNIDMKSIIVLMVKRSIKIYNEIRETAIRPLEMREAFLLASLIQTESHTKEEGPLIASVFLNRLRIGMRLQCDPTVIYALRRHGLYSGRLLRRDLSFDDIYNTYVYNGYPPTPIANPGYDALFSAMNPAVTDYLYFVARDSRTHVFSRTYQEHLENIRRIRRN